MTGSVNRGKNDPSQSLQVIERSLMTPDELKSMPKGQFVVMKTGFYPMNVKLKLFFKWGIKFEKEYEIPENGNRKVAYAEKKELIDGIVKKYRSDWLMEDDILPNAMPVDGTTLAQSEKNIAKKEAASRAKGRKTGGLKISPRNIPIE